MYCRAPITCAQATCRKFYHFGCALSVGCTFSESRLSTDSPKQSHDIYTLVFCPHHRDAKELKQFRLKEDWAPADPKRLIFLTEELDDKSPAQGQDEDFENVMQAAVAKRLVSSSFGLSFPNANLDRFQYLLPLSLKHTHTHTHTHTL